MLGEQQGTGTFVNVTLKSRLFIFLSSANVQLSKSPFYSGPKKKKGISLTTRRLYKGELITTLHILNYGYLYGLLTTQLRGDNVCHKAILATEIK